MIAKQICCFLIFTIVTFGQVGWQPVNSPGPSQKIKKIFAHNDTLYAAASNGIYYSANSGGRWDKISDESILSFDYSGEINVAGDNILVAGVGVYVLSKSDTGWNITSHLTNMRVRSLAVSGNYIFAGTYKGIYISKDLGNTWEESNIGLNSTDIRSLDLCGNKLFAGLYNDSVFVSEDFGNTWSPETDLKYFRTAISLNDTTILAGTGDGIFISYDNGNNWASASQGLTNKTIHTLFKSGEYIYAGTSTGGIFVSQNGYEWSGKNRGIDPPKIVYTFTALNNNKIFAGTYTGVCYTTDNGEYWKNASANLSESGCLDLVEKGQELYAGMLHYGVYKSSDMGRNWSKTNMEEVDVTDLEISGDNILAATHGRGVLLTTDNGLNWNESNNGINDIVVRYIKAYKNNLIAASDNLGIFVSSNGGAAWVARNTGLASQMYFSDVVISGENIFVSSSYNGVYRSQDDMKSWVEINNGLDNKGVSKLTVHNGILFAATRGGIFRSLNNGDDWEIVCPVAGYDQFKSIVSTDRLIIAGSEYNGVLVSPDDGLTWRKDNTGLAVKRVGMLTIIGTKVFAGATEEGIWYRPLADFEQSLSVDEPKAPISFSLYQNYPNPFNPSTKIRFALPEISDVKIVIYNILGEEIEILLNEELEAGIHEVQFNASDINSGVYFCRITTGKHSSVNKMILIK